MFNANFLKMICQAITQAGAISADWILTISFVIIGTLLMGFAYVIGNNFLTTLKNINEKLLDHDEKFDEHLKLHHEIKLELNSVKTIMNSHNNKLADEIITKIRAMTPPKK